MEKNITINLFPFISGTYMWILYELNANPSNFAWRMWALDSSGRIVMAETTYDVKGEPEELRGTFIYYASEQAVEESSNTYQQYELSSNTQVDGQEYEVAIIENPGEPPERYCNISKRKIKLFQFIRSFEMTGQN